VANDERLAGGAVFHLHAHHQDVLQGDEVVAVLGYENVFRAPALVWRIGLQCRIESQHFEEVETDAIRAGHRQDGAAVALLRAQAGLAQPFPGIARRGVENDR